MQELANDSRANVTPAPSVSRVFYRHSLVVRITHWISALALFCLLLSGFQIFNAHPALYWGQQSDFKNPWLAMTARTGSDGNMRGLTLLFGHEFDTTGWLGASRVAQGQLQADGFPAWLTIPGSQWLALGRRWHFFFAWVLVLNGGVYAIYALVSRHLVRELLPTRTDWRGIGRSIVDHARLRRPKGEAAARYNILQRISYLSVIFLLAPLMILTGLAMSPRMDTVLGWFLSLLGGRQSARSLHFIVTFMLVAFFLVHVFQVVLTGAVNNMRSMITGRFRVEPETGAAHNVQN